MGVYEREVIRWEEYLGGIAGMYDLFLSILMLFFGNYISYETHIKWIRSFYSYQFTQNNNVDDEVYKSNILN